MIAAGLLRIEWAACVAGSRFVYRPAHRQRMGVSKSVRLDWRPALATHRSISPQLIAHRRTARAKASGDGWARSASS